MLSAFSSLVVLIPVDLYYFICYDSVKGNSCSNEVRSLLEFQSDLTFINFFWTKFFFFIFLTIILRNFKTFVLQVHLLYCIYEGKEVNTYCIYWRLLTETESITACLSGNRILRGITCNIIERAKETNYKQHYQD